MLLDYEIIVEFVNNAFDKFNNAFLIIKDDKQQKLYISWI